MDIAGSNINLYGTNSNHGTEDKDENLKELISSCKSLSKYESSSFRSLWPQIVASLIAAAFHIGNGTSMAYSAVLIAQLKEPDSEIKTTDQENSWIASVLIIAVLFSSTLSGILMDNLGRLNTIKLASIPGVLGWSITALSNQVSLIIVGRILVGVSAAWGTSPGLVYISEISSSHIRMSLMALAPTYVAFGMILMYLGGYLIHWRLLAWLSTIFMVTPAILCCFIHESPSWLILKGKPRRAQKSLEWLHRYQPNPADKSETYAELQLKLLQEEQKKSEEQSKNRKVNGIRAVIKEFMKPTGYKPILTLCGLFFFHHFSGLYITMFYSISFIEEAGTSMNAYIASILIGTVRLIMSIAGLFILKMFRRRTLLMFSCLFMSLWMFVAGLYTSWIQDGTSTAKWVPVMSLLLYVIFSTIGFLNIPAMLIAELFPLEIRGIGYSITYSFYCLFMFTALHSYYNLRNFFGGATHLQWFFSVMCLAGLVYTYIFVPETKGKKLESITEYFRKGCVYIGRDIDDEDCGRNNTKLEV
nr:unnamed protein product [Callosobruchus analis]